MLVITWLRSHGKQGYLVVISRDVTERRRIENELKKRIEDLEKFYEMAVGRELKKEIRRLKN